MEPPVWQNELRQCITNTQQLEQLLDLPCGSLKIHSFPLKVTPLYLSLIEKGNPQDPLLRQVLSASGAKNTSFSNEPLQESHFNPVPGLLHKYQHRVLLTLTGACAIHCQYCFRQNFAYLDNQLSPARWQNILDYLREDKSIQEVIFSGGDPLMLNNKILAQLFSDLRTITHLRSLRIHTRIPTVLPSRLDNQLLELLTQQDMVMVLHINHANELCEAHETLKTLARNITLLNQSVMLAGVNDDANTLASLSWRLFDHGILPYYLHRLDPVIGAESFAVDETRLQSIYHDLLAQLPGYRVPRLVCEEPGAQSKTPLASPVV